VVATAEIVTVVEERVAPLVASSEDTSPFYSANSYTTYTGAFAGSSDINWDSITGWFNRDNMAINNFNIYVGNLSLEMTEDELRNEFTEFGEVVSVNIIDEKHIGSGQQRKYAYVEMSSKDEGEIAIVKLEGKKMRNKVINVIKALPLSSKHGTGFHNIRSNRQFNDFIKKGKRSRCRSNNYKTDAQSAPSTKTNEFQNF